MRKDASALAVGYIRTIGTKFISQGYGLIWMLLYPRELELGSCWRPSCCLVEGSIRTLKKYFQDHLYRIQMMYWEELQ